MSLTPWWTWSRHQPRLVGGWRLRLLRAHWAYPNASLRWGRLDGHVGLELHVKSFRLFFPYTAKGVKCVAYAGDLLVMVEGV